uniref:Uncharacterized protein n=1 Tax=uncultured marine virus TaxID=186617 RepID=A0A0F7LAX0_9VIRU|nr:hypothetical protein [uncultured marine virus]
MIISFVYNPYVKFLLLFSCTSTYKRSFKVSFVSIFCNITINFSIIFRLNIISTILSCCHI